MKKDMKVEKGFVGNKDVTGMGKFLREKSLGI